MRAEGHKLAFALMAALAVAGLSPVAAFATDRHVHQLAQSASGAATPAEPPAPVLTGSVPEVTGPKRTVAVGKFDSIGAFNNKYGNWDIGGGLAAMMTTALVESGRFIVVERAQLQQVLAEQEM